ncbi:MAG TPA: hypothetical protein VGJ48_21440 [Pyrinomonadaceae bacterium]
MQNLITRRGQTMMAAVLISALVLLTTACPSENQVRKAAKASNNLANLTNNVTDAVRIAFQAGQISADTKNKMADALILIAKEGKIFNDMLIANQSSAQNGTFPPNIFAQLTSQFDKVVQPFLEMGTTLNLLGPNGNQKLAQTFAALRAAILIISAAFQ